MLHAIFQSYAICHKPCHMCSVWRLRIHPSEPLTFIIEAFQDTQPQSSIGVSCNLLRSSHILKEKCLWNNTHFHNIPVYNTSVKALMWGRMSSSKVCTHFVACLHRNERQLCHPQFIQSRLGGNSHSPLPSWCYFMHITAFPQSSNVVQSLS